MKFHPFEIASYLYPKLILSQATASAHSRSRFGHHLLLEFFRDIREFHCGCITVYLKVQMRVTGLWGDLVNEIRVNGTLILLVHFLFLCWGSVLLFEINPKRFLFIRITFVSFATEFQTMLCPEDLLFSCRASKKGFYSTCQILLSFLLE